MEIARLPPLCDAVHVGKPYVSTAIAELQRLGKSRPFVLANRSNQAAVQCLLQALEKQGLGPACPLSCDVGMGGGELGLLKACDSAAAAHADSVITVGGGAIQDAGKLIRMFLSSTSADDPGSSIEKIQSACKREPMPPLPPQIACPNSFAMAELTSVAGVTLSSNTKSGAACPSLMPTAVVFDPELAIPLPEWVRFGTALRCVEHAVGAISHPKSTDAVRALALEGLALVRRGLERMLADPTSAEAMTDVYTGGWLAIRALNTGCYPALGHLIANIYSAKVKSSREPRP